MPSDWHVARSRVENCTGHCHKGHEKHPHLPNSGRSVLPKQRYILAIDQGTTRTKAALIGENGSVRGFGSANVTRIFPHPGWVEEDPAQIWSSILIAVRTAMRRAKCRPKEIVGVGLDNQGETVIAWDKRSGNPVYNAIVWQCRRTSELCARLRRREGLEREIRRRTGLTIDPYFSATKIRWILDNVRRTKNFLRSSQLLLGTSDAWLVWKMSGRRRSITDYATASRTMLFNIHRMRWDPYLLRTFEIPEAPLPEVVPNCGELAHTDPRSFLGIDAPISGLIVDQQAALFGQGCHSRGELKNTYGTGCFMLMNTGNAPVSSHHGLLTTVAWVINGKKNYALDGGVYTAGSAIDWLANGLGIIKSVAETEKMANSIPNNGGVYFVPAFVGLAAPYWDPIARGTIVGITDKTTAANLARATLEGIAYQVNEVLLCMNADSGLSAKSLKVDGGPTANRFLMQFQADISGISVKVPQISEMTVRGTALLAGLGIDFWDDISKIVRSESQVVYAPKMSNRERTQLLDRWRRAVECSRAWGGEKKYFRVSS